MTAPTELLPASWTGSQANPDLFSNSATLTQPMVEFLRTVLQQLSMQSNTCPGRIACPLDLLADTFGPASPPSPMVSRSQTQSVPKTLRKGHCGLRAGTHLEPSNRTLLGRAQPLDHLLNKGASDLPFLCWIAGNSPHEILLLLQCRMIKKYQSLI